MSDNQHITIPKEINSENDLDFDFLRKEGIKYIEKVGNKLWTDYNTHDPGITILDVLSYAITDLGARMDLDMKDLLASETKPIDEQFFKASEILPSSPINDIDYRKLFLDIGPIEIEVEDKTGNKEKVFVRPIKNCWVTIHKETIHVNCKTGAMFFDEKSITTPADARSFEVKGLYKILIDFDERLSAADQNTVIEEVKKRYHANRNLCEDLVLVEEVQSHAIAICAKIEVENDADEEYINAQVIHTIENYLRPNITFYSLEELLDKGQTTDEIFEGPLLNNGFVDSNELVNSNLPDKIYLSDVINKIMDIKGIKQINEITLGNCGFNEATPYESWSIDIEEGKKPVMCEFSSFSYNKGVLPLNLNEDKVNEYLSMLRESELRDFQAAKNNKEIEIESGTAYQLDSHNTIMDDFPEVYGVGSNGIASDRSTKRKALAKQMKGYLLFFDQIFASYFKHLSEVKDLLSINSDANMRTYFTKAIEGIKDFNELVKEDYPNDDDSLTELLYNELDNNVIKRNQILDHLLARFAERFSDYTFLMKSLYGDAADEITLQNKQDFLRNYDVISTNRSDGFNYYLQDKEDIWDTDNVSGVQKRIARLLGIKDSNRRNLSDSPVNLIQATLGTGETVYRWEIQTEDGTTILSSLSSTDYDESLKTEFSANEQIEEAVFAIIQITDNELEDRLKELDDILSELVIGDHYIVENIKIIKHSKTLFKIEIIDSSGQTIAKQDAGAKYIISKLKEQIEKLVSFFKYKYTEEGIFLVESILFKPNLASEPCGVGCMEIGDDDDETNFQVDKQDVVQGTFVDNCDTDCDLVIADPYSFRINVILPGYSYRFSNPDFRKYAETIIRQEIPAHILTKICWVSDRRNKIIEGSNEESESDNDELVNEDIMSDLVNFEEAYKEFLMDKSTNSIAQLNDSSKKLSDALTALNNFYEPSQLIDCDDDSDDLSGKFIIGQSNLKIIKKL